LASALFNPVERSFNLGIADRLRGLADVFLPQRDGKLLTRLIDEGRSVREARAMVYHEDVQALERCDGVVAVLDGRTVDEGVAFELGYARALGKLCIGLKTDDRCMLPTGDNPMIVMGCHRICSSMDELVDALAATLPRTRVA
jgi:Nucleoside 2-deoxyribosyltransferase